MPTSSQSDPTSFGAEQSRDLSALSGRAPALALESRIEVYKTSPEMFTSQKLQALYDHWEGLRSGHAIPRSRDLSPINVGFILGQITLVDVLSGPLNFYYRLIGTRIEELGRHGDQGKTVDQIRPACYRQLCRDAYHEAVETAAPLCLRICRRQSDGEVGYERMILPFGGDEGRVVTLLDALDWAPGVQIELQRLRLLPSANVPVDMVFS
ncbi:MAG: PAS domain-containing protein [Pseudomonadota bacterium]